MIHVVVEQNLQVIPFGVISTDFPQNLSLGLIAPCTL